MDDDGDIVYLVDNDYSKANEQGLLWSDTTIGIEWPIKNPLLSEKDKKWPKLADAQCFP